MLSSNIFEVEKYYITKDFSIDNMLKYDFVEELSFILNKNFKTTIRNARNLEMQLEVLHPQTEKFTNSGLTRNIQLILAQSPFWVTTNILI